MPKVLILDDDPMMNEALANVVARLGHEPSCAFTLSEGLDLAREEAYDVVFLDVRLPDGNGLEALPSLRAGPGAPEVIIITGYGDPDGAELAVKNGAWDYIQKPSSMGRMSLALSRALQYRAEKTVSPGPMVLKREGIVGASLRLNEALERLAQASQTEGNVLIEGETGTGKELLARAVHENSPRAGRRFVVVDCAALPESLVESILFGHEKGAFTGADRAHEGLIQQAHGGTLFLDEVGELPLPVQKAFLRAVQERRFRPVGSDREIGVDFRLIAATNRDLERMAQEGRFRKDLLYRLRTHFIQAPPLRERREDIRELAVYHVNRLCERYGTETKGFSPEFFEALSLYEWPGNVRELFNTMEEALAAAGDEPTLYPYHLPIALRARVARSSVENHEEGLPAPSSPSGPLEQGPLPTLKAFREEAERRYLQRLWHRTGASRKEMCRVSGLSRTRLFELLKKHGIPS
ncbi:MAG: sigma-54-dependent Fis family transcriptional regulator [Deltaproteobacteria bacterium]|nr:sigma-54-dependent Fis family transcriptional regulator [Deltaproteobacteria bacterium]MBW1948059.1 sigma-54-dependent Fis family transcriptional regulator [Deltaproteobacteria bacterium]MBW2009043.1 sigma-54-dependent Fis family transcriptional regulator [Deltaproteobacteria bacterium]MBW2103198.1 sigma-54-dependent Fis family transcriptional regulator [Deltaproteobacteria bacterium]